MADCNRNADLYGSQNTEATSINKKYGELAPKKKPLISKDHERAFFDSADWALGKRTPHHPLPPRKPACTSVPHVELD